MIIIQNNSWEAQDAVILDFVLCQLDKKLVMYNRDRTENLSDLYYPLFIGNG